MAYFGIDLGTTTTLIAEGQMDARGMYCGRIQLIPQSDWQNNPIKPAPMMLPSVTFFLDDEPLIGVCAKQHAAKADAIGYTDRYVHAVKRLMGRDVPPFVFSNNEYQPSDIAALYVEYVIKEVIIRGTSDELHVLTVTVPASFTTKQRQDTLRAINTAVHRTGVRLQVHRSSMLISEPLAALLSYIAHDIESGVRKINIDSHPKIVVYDIGGGTLDITLVELGWKHATEEKTLSNVTFKVIDVNRYTQVGGEDFDETLARWLHQQLCQQHPVLNDLVLSKQHRQQLRHKLIDEAEKLKIRFNDAYGDGETEVQKSIEVTVADKEYTLEVNLTEQIAKSTFECFLGNNDDPKNCITPIKSFFERTHISPDSIDYFLCVGGMSKFVLLREAIEVYLARPVLFSMATAELAVAQGAAIYSMLKGLDNEQITEPASDAYYVQTVNGFRKIIGRNDAEMCVNTKFEKEGDSQYVDLFIFAGEDCGRGNAGFDVYHTLLYQGGERIDLSRTYPKGTEVIVSIRYEGDDKTPYVTANVDNQEVFNGILGREMQ